MLIQLLSFLNFTSRSKSFVLTKVKVKFSSNRVAIVAIISSCELLHQDVTLRVCSNLSKIIQCFTSDVSPLSFNPNNFFRRSDWEWQNFFFPAWYPNYWKFPLQYLQLLRSRGKNRSLWSHQSHSLNHIFHFHALYLSLSRGFISLSTLKPSIVSIPFTCIS